MVKKSDEELTKSKVIEILENHRRDIKKHGVKKLGLFGSFLRGTQHKKSDMDFLVMFDKPTFDNYMELKFLLEELFRRKVDLVVGDNLKPALKYVKEEAVYVKGL